MKSFYNVLLIFACFLVFTPSEAIAQKKENKKEEAPKTPLEELKLSELKFRSIGPAFTSGRVSDIAVNPNNTYEYYVATSSGGVWKTQN